MFEYRSLWSSVLRVVAGASLVLLLTLGIGGLTAAPAAAQVDSSVTVSDGTGSDGTTVTVTAEDGDEWENDILNGTPPPATFIGVFDPIANSLHRALDWVSGLMDATRGSSK